MLKLVNFAQFAILIVNAWIFGINILKKHNPNLELFGVVYCHELGKKDYTALQPYLDGVNLWFWYQEELLEIDKYINLCRENFPGKKIFMGLFLHDYGTADGGTLPELLLHPINEVIITKQSSKQANFLVIDIIPFFTVKF